MPTKKQFTLDHNISNVMRELMASNLSRPATKDILIVVRDQKEWLEKCINSIVKYTKDFNIYIWDNASQDETANYILDLGNSPSVNTVRSEENLGFIVANNRLAELGNSEYIILLNSDTEVRDGWDKSMVGWLQENPKVKEVGFLGGWLDENGRGYRFGLGKDIDYICGWGLCVSRDTYKQYGLFDEENLEFAYGEDSDLSLRLRDAGHEIYALHVDLVVHYENKTINEVKKERDIHASFNKNHAYIKSKWEKYLIP